MIVSKTVLGAIAPKWDKELFSSRWAAIIGGWCVRYYNKYHKAPKKQIEGIFDGWAEDGTHDKDTVKLMEDFLNGLSGEYVSLRKSTNPQYIIDLAAKYFQKIQIKKLKEEVEGHLETGETDKAFKLIHSFNRIEIGTGAEVDVLKDFASQKEAFESKKDPIITLPGPVGKFFGDALERDAFIGIEGPEKRGKTYILMWLAWQAMLQRRKVVFFQVGDLSKNQIMMRFMVRASRHPLKPCTLLIPNEIKRAPEESFAELTRVQERIYATGLNFNTAKAACEKVIKRTKTDDSLLKLFVYPSNSVSIAGVTSDLHNLERKGWVPDVVVIDYADILAPLSGIVESRDQINATWLGMRRISQELHCLVVTASQTDAGSYDAKIITKGNFSGDKRKNAHVTGMVGLNQTSTEKANGIMRLNWIVLREGEYSEHRCVHIAGCLGLAKPCMVSTF